MWRTVLFNLYLVFTVTGRWVDEQGLLTIKDWSYPSEESLVYWHRRLAGNESASSMNSHSGIQLHHLITEIGVIVAYTLIALGILLIIFSWIYPWMAAETEIYTSQVSVRKSAIFCTDSALLTPIDGEEIQSVLVDYERITAQLNKNHAMDFARCKSVSVVFKNTKPVVTPFVRKSHTLPSSSNGGAEILTKPIITDDVFDENGTASDSSTNLCALPGLEGFDISRSKDDISFESPRIRKALSFYIMSEGTFEISRGKQKLPKNDSVSLIFKPIDK